MEAEYLAQFEWEDICEDREDTELDIWFKDFNSKEAFIDNGDMPF
ncbi:hypothetical protein R3379_14875 [Bacillus sp. BAU-SS-2023]|nr:hypothetical protein [Bacillus sp. BAU-SS-2023]